MFVVKLNSLPLSHKVTTSWKMEDGHTLGVAIMMAKNNGAWQMDVLAPNITPFTFNLKVEIPHFVGFVGTCTMLRWKHTKPPKIVGPQV